MIPHEAALFNATTVSFDFASLFTNSLISSSLMASRSVSVSNADGTCSSSEVFVFIICANVCEFFFAAANSNPQRSSRSMIAPREEAVYVMPRP